MVESSLAMKNGIKAAKEALLKVEGMEFVDVSFDDLISDIFVNAYAMMMKMESMKMIMERKVIHNEDLVDDYDWDSDMYRLPIHLLKKMWHEKEKAEDRDWIFFKSVYLSKT